MGQKGEKLSTIGEMARKSGVPVKTIRHYSDVGVLPPSGVTGSGYRLYSGRDLSRLELVRNLRAAGFDLKTIRLLIEEKGDPSEALELQLETVDLQLRTLKRRRKLLESAIGNGGEAARSYPDRARALGLLDAREREAFLAEHLERGLEGIAVDPEVRAWFWRQIVSDVPENLTDEQLEAWVELANLASDEGFVEKIRRQTRPFWEAAAGHFDHAEWRGATDEAFREATAALREGRPPSGEREQRVIGEWVEAQARAMGKSDDPRFPGWLLSHYGETADPRMQRYWYLISMLKQTGYDPACAEAHGWLVEGLRIRATNPSRGPSRAAPS